MTRVAGSPRIRRRVAGLFVAAVLMVGLAVGPASPASAYSINCGGPRCTAYFNHAETNNFAYWGSIPQAPGGIWSAVWFLFIMPQRWFAIQYANRGQCIGFNLSLVPWESQGCSATTANDVLAGWRRPPGKHTKIVQGVK